MLGITKRQRRLRASKHSVKTVYKATKFVVQCPMCQVGKYSLPAKVPMQQGANPFMKKHRCVKCQEWFKVVR